MYEDIVPKGFLVLDGYWSRCWPLRRGKGLVCRALDVACRLGFAGPGWREYNGLNLWLDPRNYMSRCLLHTGEYQPEVSKAIVTLLPEGGTFVDAGANVGYMSMLAARRVGAHGEVFAIEPSPQMADVLGSHLDRNGFQNVTVVQAGCSNARGSLPLFIAPGRNSGMTSLSCENAHSNQSVCVDVAPLDELLAKYNPKRLDLLKIDVEGAELQVLQGALETLKRFRPVILMELDPRLLKSFGTSPQDIFDLLTQARYAHEPLSESDIIARPLAGDGQ